jgi:hypothetical protein
MSVAYCIAAHTQPAQCRRLVRRLLDDDPEGKVILHYDQRQSPFDAHQMASDRVRIVRGRAVYWGGTQVVDLFEEMFDLAVGDGCSYVVMLSGQDYPLRHLGGLEAELSAYDVWANVNPLFASDGTCNWPEGRRRYSYRWWHFDRPSKLTRGADRLAEKVLRIPTARTEAPLPHLVRFRQQNQVWWGWRSRGPGVPVHYGSMWMSLSARAVGAISSCPHHLSSFFQHVPIADEACFHTILRNTAGLTFAPGYARYIRWTDEQAHPEVLTVSDLDGMVASGAHFGRKFDEAVDASVLDRLDALRSSSRSNDAENICRGPQG